jgi:hypothetical protein
MFFFEPHACISCPEYKHHHGPRGEFNSHLSGYISYPKHIRSINITMAEGNSTAIRLHQLPQAASEAWLSLDALQKPWHMASYGNHL